MGPPLFDKTYHELHKAFIRARFAEPAVFGCEDIEALLDGQKPDSCMRDMLPWRARSFQHYLSAVWDSPDSMYEAMGRVLRERATPQGASPKWFTRRLFHREPFALAMSALAAGGCQVYYPVLEEVDRVALVVRGRETLAVDVSEDSDKHSQFMGLRRARMWDIVQCLLDEYVFGDKAWPALEFLKGEYRTAVAREREAAQRDFDEAVAVSPDGTKIVKAKWVLVCGRTPEWRNKGYLLRGETFRAHKCRLRKGYSFKVDLEFLEDIRDFGVGFTTEDLFRGRVACYCLNPHIFDFYYLRESQQVFHGQLESLLVIDESFCPSPLPDGGREIRV